MTCLEHLIENTLCEMEKNKSYKEIKESIVKDINLKESGITAAQCWEICQYVYYDYINETERKMRNYDTTRNN